MSRSMATYFRTGVQFPTAPPKFNIFLSIILQISHHHKVFSMKEIRLDYLQNPPLSDFARCILPQHAFSSIANKGDSAHIESQRNALKSHFGKANAMPFNFSAGGFAEIFLQFKKIYFPPALHYEIRRALDIVRPFVTQIALDSTNRVTEITTPPHDKDSTLIIAPLINEDIFTRNAIPQVPNATLALDISYALALGLSVESNADILFANATPLGLVRDFGLIISDRIYTSTIHKRGVSEAFLGAINERRAKFVNADSAQNLAFFEILKSHFGKDIDLFARDFAPHTLPLRFRHINTRYLIEHLYLENIFAQPAQDCALGFVKPSHTLLAQGFSPVQARELCAVSFERLCDMELLAQKLFESYRMIRLMEF